jgi:hypothetical protein
MADPPAPVTQGGVVALRFFRVYLAVCLLAVLPRSGWADGQWVLEQSTLTYHMTHVIHQVDAVSHSAKGKGTCHGGMCDFLIAAPVNSFDSGDSNRDLHMLQVTRGAQFPMVMVRTRIAAGTPVTGTIFADLEVQFAGQTMKYNHVPFEKSTNGNTVRIVGTVPATCSDFKIEPPSFLTVPIKNEIPVKVDMTWLATP